MKIQINVCLNKLRNCSIFLIILCQSSTVISQSVDIKVCHTYEKDVFYFYQQLCADFGNIFNLRKGHLSVKLCKPGPIYKANLNYNSGDANIGNEFEYTLAGNGGWSTVKKDTFEAPPGPCTIDKISKLDLSQQKFLQEYAFDKPVVIVGASKNEVFKYLTRYDKLLNHYGNTTVRLSSANSYSYDRRIITFKEYCEAYLEPQSLKTFGNETFYFFGDNSNEDWLDLYTQYNYPPYSLPGHSAQLSFGIAGPGSGVPFHFHGPGFAETLWGRKRWFMYPPQLTPPFHPNRTTLQWLHEEYPKLQNDPHLAECTLNPGEYIYFPNHWWHATLNIDSSVFMSTFLSP